MAGINPQAQFVRQSAIGQSVEITDYTIGAGLPPMQIAAADNTRFYLAFNNATLGVRIFYGSANGPMWIDVGAGSGGPLVLKWSDVGRLLQSAWYADSPGGGGMQVASVRFEGVR